MAFELKILVAFLIFVGLGIISAMADGKKVKAFLNELAQKRNGTLKKVSAQLSIPGKVKENIGLVVIFPYKNSKIYCYQEIFGSDPLMLSAHMSVSFSLNISKGISFKLFRRNLVTSYLYDSKETTHKTNDSAFDKKFIIQTNDVTLIDKLILKEFRNNLILDKKDQQVIEIKDNYFKAYYTLSGEMSIDRYDEFIDFTLQWYDRIKELSYI